MSSMLAEKALLPDHQRMVKVTLGACLFVYKNAMLQCPCSSDSLVIQAHSLSAGDPCDDCGHPLSRHQDYGLISRGHGKKNELMFNRPNAA